MSTQDDIGGGGAPDAVLLLSSSAAPAAADAGSPYAGYGQFEHDGRGYGDGGERHKATTDGALQRRRGGSPWSNVAARLARLRQRTFVTALAASLASFLIGYDMGVVSIGWTDIQQSFPSGAVPSKGLFMSSFNFAAALGALVAGRTADIYGRCSSLSIAAGFYFFGSLLSAAAASYSTAAMLVLPRLLCGVGAGMGLTVGPMLAAEVAPAEHRGLFAAVGDLAVSLGFAAGCVAAFSCGWGWGMGLGAAPAAALALAVAAGVLRESPQWLALASRVSDAAAALLYWDDGGSSNDGGSSSGLSEDAAGALLDEIVAAAGGGTMAAWTGPGQQQQQLQQQQQQQVGATGVVGRGSGEGGKAGGSAGWAKVVLGPWRELLTPSHTSPSHTVTALRQIVVFAVGVAFYQQAVGTDSWLFMFSPDIFSAVGLTSPAAVVAATVAVALVRAAMVVLPLLLLDEIGRRPLLLMSSAGLTCWLLLHALLMSSALPPSSATVSDPAAEGALAAATAVLVLISTCVGAALLSLGLSSAAWLLPPEAFPLQLRAAGCGLSVAANRLTSAVVASSFVRVAALSGGGSVFSAFAACSAAAVVFFALSVPETRGHSVQRTCALFDAQEGSTEGAPQGGGVLGMEDNMHHMETDVASSTSTIGYSIGRRPRSAAVDVLGL